MARKSNFLGCCAVNLFNRAGNEIRMRRQTDEKEVYAGTSYHADNQRRKKGFHTP
jgi:hypothetical protein